MIDMTMANRVSEKSNLQKKSPALADADYEDCTFEEFLGITKVFCYLCGGILCTLGIAALLLHYTGA